MSSTYLSKPGEKYGPCKRRCEHRDCAQTRKMAETPCRICKEPIGYDRHFYQEENWKVLVHEVCLVEEIKAERNKPREVTKFDETGCRKHTLGIPCIDHPIAT